MSAFQQRREQIAHRYSDSFSELDTCFVPRDAGYGMHAWHLYILELNLEALAVGRNDVVERLRQKGVATSVHFIPLNLHPVYQRTYGYQPGQFPIAEAAFERACSLPIYPAMTDEDVDHVIDAARTTLRESRR
jgi:dTDP-4-amino-4,6-dideoxygalactose transaminase